MHYIPLLFLCAKVFSFIYHRELALFLHNFRAIVEARRSTKKVHVVFIDKTTIFFLIYFLIQINNSYYNLFLVLRSCGGANVLKYLFGGDFIAYNDKKQIITYEKYFHQTI